MCWHIIDRLSEPDRIRLGTSLAAKTKDPNVRVAIMSQAMTGSFYNGTYQNIVETLVRSGIPREKIDPESDRVILQATLRYLETLHPALLRVIFEDFVAGFTDASNQRIAYGAFDANKSAARDKVARPGAWKSLVQWPALNLQYATYLADRARLDPYINLEGSAPLGLLALLAIGFTISACLRKRRLTQTAILALCILFFGTLVYAVNTICVYYMPRYALPLFVATVVALLASIAAQEICRD